MSNENKLPGSEVNSSRATREEIDAIITHRLILFHDALVTRGQIKPMPEVHDLYPDASESEDRKAA